MSWSDHEITCLLSSLERVADGIYVLGNKVEELRYSLEGKDEVKEMTKAMCIHLYANPNISAVRGDAVYTDAVKMLQEINEGAERAKGK